MGFQTTTSFIKEQIKEVAAKRASGVIPNLSGYDLNAHFTFDETSESRKASKPSFLPDSLTVSGVTYFYLARGAEAAVYYDHESSSILKRSLTVREMRQIHSHDKNLMQRGIANITKFHRVTDLTKQHLESGRLDPALVAHTSIDDRRMIKQAWAPPVETEFSPTAIDKYPSEKVKELIDKFAKCFVRGFRSGLCETECSLFTNYSLARNGELTIPDFGNVTYDYSGAEASVSGVITRKEIEQFALGNRVPQNEIWPDWFKKGQVRQALRDSPQLFRYFVQTMSERVNVETLETYWPEKYR
jgi:hypothetical protein